MSYKLFEISSVPTLVYSFTYKMIEFLISYEWSGVLIDERKIIDYCLEIINTFRMVCKFQHGILAPGTRGIT